MDGGRAKSGIGGLDAMIGGGFVRGSVIAVAGGTGSGRTIFASQFIHKGASEFSEPGLFVSFDSQKESIFSNLAVFGWDMADLERKQKLVFIDYPQNELASFAEQESAMKDLISTLGIKRVVIDSITPFALMFPSSEERRINTFKLVNAVKGWKVTALITAELVHGADDVFPHTLSGVELFADGFIHLSFRRESGVRTRAVEIIKMRGCRHIHEMKSAQITGAGFSIGEQKAAKKRGIDDDSHA